MIFKNQRKKIDRPVKLKHNCNRLYPSESVKHLAIKNDENLKMGTIELMPYYFR